MNVLIIGCGFLGRVIADDLKKMHSLLVTTTAHEIPKFKFQCLKPSTYNKLHNLIAKADVIIVTASGTHYGYLASYLSLARRIKKALINQPKKTLIYTSSTGVYLETGKQCLENSPLDTENSKVLVNTEKTYLTIPKHRVIVLRLSGLYGKNRTISNFYKSYEAKPIIPKWSNFIHVSQAAYAVLYCLKYPVRGIFNISSQTKLNTEIFKILFHKDPLIAQKKQQPLGKKIDSSKIKRQAYFDWPEQKLY